MEEDIYGKNHLRFSKVDNKLQIGDKIICINDFIILIVKITKIQYNFSSTFIL